MFIYTIFESTLAPGGCGVRLRNRHCLEYFVLSSCNQEDKLQMQAEQERKTVMLTLSFIKCFQMFQQ